MFDFGLQNVLHFGPDRCFGVRVPFTFVKNFSVIMCHGFVAETTENKRKHDPIDSLTYIQSLFPK